MKTIQLENKRDFPLTTTALKYIQEAYSDFEQLAKLGGDNYILTGGVVTGTAASSGWVVIAGRLMPFVGGTIQSNVRVVATSTVITVGRGTREHTVYTAEFGTSANPAENIEWDVLNSRRITNVLTLESLIQSIIGGMGGVKNIAIPIGSWNMDTLGSIDVQLPSAVGDIVKIVSYNVIIFDDTERFAEITDTVMSGGVKAIQAFATKDVPNPGLWIRIYRTASGYYDSAQYSSTSVNRGYVYVNYID